jgi:pilus assembly protein CpaF
VSAPLLERVRARLALRPGMPTSAEVAAVVRAEAAGLLGDDDVLLEVRRAVDELAGAGPLEPLLRAPGVTDVLVNGPDQVWIDQGRGLEPAPVGFADDAAVRRLAVRLAAAAGRRLDDAAP